MAVTPGQKGESPCSDNRKFTFDLQQELMLQSYVTSDSLLSLCRLQLKSRFYAYWTYLGKVGWDLIKAVQLLDFFLPGVEVCHDLVAALALNCSSTAVDICIHLLKEETRLSQVHFICKSLLPTGTRFQGFASGIDCAFALLWLNVKDNNLQDQSKQNANGECKPFLDVWLDCQSVWLGVLKLEMLKGTVDWWWTFKFNRSMLLLWLACVYTGAGPS